MERRNFKGHTIYGEILHQHELLEMIENGLSPIEVNNLQGKKACEFVEHLISITELRIYVDVERMRDGGDTLFIEFVKELPILDTKKLFEYIATFYPDELHFNDDYNVLRLWWD